MIHTAVWGCLNVFQPEQGSHVLCYRQESTQEQARGLLTGPDASFNIAIILYYFLDITAGCCAWHVVEETAAQTEVSVYYFA